MADLKRILIVDDHPDILEILQSMLEMSSDFRADVVAAGTAEEAFLAARQADIDLIITDVGLPGMGGFDLIRRIRGIQAELPAIVITGAPLEKEQIEADDLGIKHYYPKPLDSSRLLVSVKELLRGGGMESNKPSVAPVQTLIPTEVSPQLDEKIRQLRLDTGARATILATADGAPMLTVGDRHGLDVDALSSIMATNFNSSVALSEEMSSEDLTLIQYQSGRNDDLFVLNAGQYYFVMIFIDTKGSQRRGRIGTIWTSAQKAGKELLALLPDERKISKLLRDAERAGGVDAVLAANAAKASGISFEKRRQKRRTKAKPTLVVKQINVVVGGDGAGVAEDPELEELSDIVVTDEMVAEFMPELADGDFFAAASEDTVDFDSFWDIEDTSEFLEESSRPGEFSLEEAQEEGLVAVDSSEAPVKKKKKEEDVGNLPGLDFSETESDADSFWDEAISEGLEDELPIPGTGFSLEEAQKKGLLPVDLTSEEAEPEAPAKTEAKKPAKKTKKTTKKSSKATKSKPKEKPAEKDASLDLDDFWNVGDLDEKKDEPQALSFEEAMKRGLLGQAPDIPEE